MIIRQTIFLGTLFCVAAASIPMAQAAQPSSAVNTLGQLQCIAGEVALYNGTDWVCSDITAALQDALDELTTRVNDLEAENQTQQAAIDALETENQALTDRLACVKSSSSASEIVFEGCNVHVRNGAGQTDSINGFGNLIIGYDEERIDASCSLGFFYNSNQTDCEAAGGIWWTSNKTGSHNMVIGTEHNYNSFGGFVAGTRNTISDEYASVSGGAANTAADRAASVSGGGANSARGWYASVSGGAANIAKGVSSSVSGGEGCIHPIGSENSWGVGDTVFGTGCVTNNNTP